VAGVAVFEPTTLTLRLTEEATADGAEPKVYGGGSADAGLKHGEEESGPGFSQGLGYGYGYQAGSCEVMQGQGSGSR